MPRKVYVELTGEQIDIDDLIFALNTSDWKIVKEGDKYYLNSPFLDDILETDEIIYLATEFMNILNGAATIFHPDHKKVGIGSLKIIVEDGKANHIIFGETGVFRLRSRLRATAKTSSDPDPKTIPTIIETWLNKSLENEKIAEALHYFNEINWYNLFKIYEIIKPDLDNKKLDVSNLYPSETLKNFAHNANMKRHSKGKLKLPEAEMTLKQAQQLITGLFKKWLDTK